MIIKFFTVGYSGLRESLHPIPFGRLYGYVCHTRFNVVISFHILK